MSAFAEKLGVIAFWLTWPGIWLVIRLSPSRTRAIIVASNKVLLIRAWLGPNNWSLPGGGRKFGETVEAGVIREVQEETGISLNQSQLRKLGSRQLKENGITAKLDIFIVRLDDERQTRLRKPEIIDGRWFGRSEFNTIRLSNATQQILDSISGSDLLK